MCRDFIFFVFVLSRRNFTYVRLDGTLSQVQREKVIKEFSTNPKILVFFVKSWVIVDFQNIYENTPSFLRNHQNTLIAYGYYGHFENLGMFWCFPYFQHLKQKIGQTPEHA